MRSMSASQMVSYVSWVFTCALRKGSGDYCMSLLFLLARYALGTVEMLRVEPKTDKNPDWTSSAAFYRSTAVYISLDFRV